jgi:16S rRNA (cytidine1402-2'-O)-methyltransferase
MKFQPGLYVVSTPIGNLSDITLRAIETLQNSDIVLCEDTRVSNKLLAKHNIKASLKLYNDKSDSGTRDWIEKQIASGKVLSLISDAGTPLISDPGYKLVRDLKAKNLHVDVIPGPCAAIAALTISGLATDQFFFSGFLPKTREGRQKIFENLASLDASLIFYETANRLLQSLEVALEVLGDRDANVTRELTKLHQESRLQKLSELIDHYQKNPAKGEIVVMISGMGDWFVSDEVLEQEVKILMKRGESAKGASDIMFEKYKNTFSRRHIYNVANSIKNSLAKSK